MTFVTIIIIVTKVFSYMILGPFVICTTLRFKTAGIKWHYMFGLAHNSKTNDSDPKVPPPFFEVKDTTFSSTQRGLDLSKGRLSIFINRRGGGGVVV